MAEIKVETRPPGGDGNDMWANFRNVMHLVIMEARNADNEQSSKDAKLPPFWPKMPTTWFQCIESKFALKGITQLSYHLM